MEFVVIEKDDAYTISEIFNVKNNAEDNTTEMSREESESDSCLSIR